MAASFKQEMLRFRSWLVPEHLQLGWSPILSLGYLAFLFLPAIFGRGEDRWSVGVPYGSLELTILTVIVFLPFYFLNFRSSGLRMVLCILAIASLAFALLPYNAFSNTYLIYAAGALAWLKSGLWQRTAWLVLLLALFLLEILWLGIPVFVFAITLIIATAVFSGSIWQVMNEQKRVALKLSHDEVRRLAALAERERIGRDLHDLLGHTLSLIALKSELAGKLFDRDARAARSEMEDVTRVARDALSQVRHAVTGIRAAGLATELASARQLLESAGVNFSYTLGDVELSVEQETALSLVVREATTNIQRHARAQRACVELGSLGQKMQMRIEDDGQGGNVIFGNGLTGIRERIEGLDGSIKVISQRGRGTSIEINLPLIEHALPSVAKVGHHPLAPR